MRTYIVFLLAISWATLSFGQGNVTQINSEPKKTTDQKPVSESVDQEQIKNDGSIDDLYRARRNTLKSVGKIQGMMSLPGSSSPSLSGSDLGDTGELYVTNEVCSQITRSPLYPHLCKLFNNSYFLAGSSIVLAQRDRWMILLIAELVFLVFISFLRAAKRKSGTELFYFGSVLREIRFSMISFVLAVIVIPSFVFGKGYLSLIWGIVQG